MTGELAHILARDDICDDDVFVASAADELRVVPADVQRVDVVVVDVLVGLYQQVLSRIVQTYAPVLRSRHAVFPLVVELGHVHRSRVSFRQLAAPRRQLVAPSPHTLYYNITDSPRRTKPFRQSKEHFYVFKSPCSMTQSGGLYGIRNNIPI
jgi:hypothetical protein